MMDIETLNQWGAWLAYAYPRLMDSPHNGEVIAEHVRDVHNGVWSEFTVRDAIFRNKLRLGWLPETIHVEDPREVLARQQAAAEKAKADAIATQAEVDRKAALAARKQREADAEWKATHQNLLGKPQRVDPRQRLIDEENQKIEDAKKTMKVVNEIMSASIQREIDMAINNYTKSNPVTGHVDHANTARLRAELRTISVKNDGKPDLPRTLDMVKAAIRKLP